MLLKTTERYLHEHQENFSRKAGGRVALGDYIRYSFTTCVDSGDAVFAYRWIALAHCTGYSTSSSFYLRRITDAMPILQLVDGPRQSGSEFCSTHHLVELCFSFLLIGFLF